MNPLTIKILILAAGVISWQQDLHSIVSTLEIKTLDT